MAKKQKRTIEVDRNISKLSKELTVIRKSYYDSGNHHLIFDKVPDDLLINKDTEHGRRVLTAYYPESHDIFLVRFYSVGEKSFPHGGVRVYNKSLDEYKLLYPQSVVKHKNVEFYKKLED